MAAFSGFMKALQLLHWEMRAVLHHRTAMAIEILTKAKKRSIKLNCYKLLKLLFQIAVLCYLCYVYLI